MKIAISHWHGRVAPVFDVADNLLLVDIENAQAVRKENVRLTGSRDSFERSHAVSVLGVQVLLCGAVSHTLETALIGAGIRVIGFVCGDLEAVIDAYLQDRLTDARFIMPGHHPKRLRGRRGPSHRRHSDQITFSTNKQKGGF